MVGLNLASEYHDNELEEHAVFLSGNLPLVTVLQEALARDKVKREKEENGRRISKDAALREVKTVIQIIHHYRDEYVGNDICPSDRVAILRKKASQEGYIVENAVIDHKNQSKVSQKVSQRCVVCLLYALKIKKVSLLYILKISSDGA